MQQIRSRVPLKFWLIIMVVVVIFAILATVHFAGIIDLSFFGAWFLGAYSWASVDIMNGLILLAGIGVPFALLGWAIQKYVIGVKIINPVAAATGQVYNPTNAPIPTVKPQVVEG